MVVDAAVRVGWALLPGTECRPPWGEDSVRVLSPCSAPREPWRRQQGVKGVISFEIPEGWIMTGYVWFAPFRSLSLSPVLRLHGPTTREWQ